MAAKPETLTYEPGSYTLDYIRRNLALPRIVRCDHTQHGGVGPDGGTEGVRVAEGGRGGGGGVGCDTALLLYGHRDVRRATGKLLVEVGKDRKLMEVGETIVIPFDYDGWFTVFPSKPKAKDVPVYQDIPALIKADCEVFLVGGKRNLQAKKKEGGWKTTLVQPGSVLKIIDRISDERYVQCTDNDGNTIYVDNDAHGVFYVISRRNNKGKKVPVMQMTHIISDPKVKMPCLIKLIQGQKPLNQPSSEGWIRLSGIERSSSFTAASVSLKENGLVEIPRQSPVKYKLATLNEAWRKFEGSIDAIRLCHKFAELYEKGIKSSKMEIFNESKFPGGSKRSTKTPIKYVFQPSISRTNPSPQRSDWKTQEPKSRPTSNTSYLTPFVTVINVTKKSSSGESSANQIEPLQAAAPSPCRGPSQYVNVNVNDTDYVNDFANDYANDYANDNANVNKSVYENFDLISNEDSLSNFTLFDEWGFDDHDYVNVDDMVSDDNDDDSTTLDYIEIWPLIQTRTKKGHDEGQRSSACDSGMFSIAGSDLSV